MEEDVFNLELRSFLKSFGVTAQREIEKAVDAALRERKLAGNEILQSMRPSAFRVCCRPSRSTARSRRPAPPEPVLRLGSSWADEEQFVTS